MVGWVDRGSRGKSLFESQRVGRHYLLLTTAIVSIVIIIILILIIVIIQPARETSYYLLQLLPLSSSPLPISQLSSPSLSKLYPHSSCITQMEMEVRTSATWAQAADLSDHCLVLLDWQIMIQSLLMLKQRNVCCPLE